MLDGRTGGITVAIHYTAPYSIAKLQHSENVTKTANRAAMGHKLCTYTVYLIYNANFAD